MKDVILTVVGLLLVVSMAGGAFIMYGQSQYEFRSKFRRIELGVHADQIKNQLGKPAGDVRNLVIAASDNSFNRDSYTASEQYRADSYSYWQQGSVTYYVGFDTESRATMTVVKFENGADLICQVKGKSKNKHRYCN